ncbi:MAG TPA: DLW-39 family protein [Micromonosporaceae bacterium]|nr:DLW-39 family protein [Micromonosporaceae bacterium]
MLKKLFLLVGVVGAAAFVAKRVKTANEERALWHEATTAPDLR